MDEYCDHETCYRYLDTGWCNDCNVMGIEHALMVCPYDEPLHEHHDGCPACDG